MKKLFSYTGGILAGILNGLLGAGGGMILVPILLKSGIERTKAHATSVCIILPICMFSAALYLYSGRVHLEDSYPYLIWGVLGAMIGTWSLPRINQNILKKIFAVLMLWASYRMLIG